MHRKNEYYIIHTDMREDLYTLYDALISRNFSARLIPTPPTIRSTCGRSIRLEIEDYSKLIEYVSENKVHSLSSLSEFEIYLSNSDECKRIEMRG